ncbi:MAG: hypothetical protein RMJ16_08730 [Thermoguttaceae bacterium]|nr:hypothetical protein [Thermoguttaceae bacterium]
MRRLVDRASYFCEGFGHQHKGWSATNRGQTVISVAAGQRLVLAVWTRQGSS